MKKNKNNTPGFIREKIEDQFEKLFDRIDDLEGEVDVIVNKIDGFIFELEEAYEDRKNIKK